MFIFVCRIQIGKAASVKTAARTHVDDVILVFMFVCRIQIGKAASVKTAATLVRELSYQNKVQSFIPTFYESNC